MEYTILYYNEDGTAKVRMTIDEKVLEQDFATDDLDANVKQGMAIFRAALDRIVTPEVREELIGVTVLVDKLPILPAKDFEPEQPIAVNNTVLSQES